MPVETERTVTKRYICEVCGKMISGEPFFPTDLENNSPFHKDCFNGLEDWVKDNIGIILTSCYENDEPLKDILNPSADKVYLLYDGREDRPDVKVFDNIEDARTWAVEVDGELDCTECWLEGIVINNKFHEACIKSQLIIDGIDK